MRIYVNRQIAEIYQGEKLLKTFKVSTAKNGVSCKEGSFCTPEGKLKVAQKIGAGCEIGTIFRARISNGEVWDFSKSSEEDLILTRILWLEGAEEKNANTFGRFIYLHGTNQEDLIGTAASHGCIRFLNQDIIEIFDLLELGSEVEIL
jgi:L,D-transpeptidase YbiS